MKRDLKHLLEDLEQYFKANPTEGVTGVFKKRVTEQLEQCNIDSVSQQRELLNDFAKMMEDDYGFSATEMNMTEGVDIYLKSVNCG